MVPSCRRVWFVVCCLLLWNVLARQPLCFYLASLPYAFRGYACARISASDFSPSCYVLRLCNRRIVCIPSVRSCVKHGLRPPAWITSTQYTYGHQAPSAGRIDTTCHPMPILPIQTAPTAMCVRHVCTCVCTCPPEYVFFVAGMPQLMLHSFISSRGAADLAPSSLLFQAALCLALMCNLRKVLP